MTDSARRPELQYEVEWLLGNCVLRLQEFERLMKAMLAGHKLAGSIETLQASRIGRQEQFATMTLGTLVKSLFESVVRGKGSGGCELSAGADQTPNKADIAIRLGLSMSDEDRAEVKAAIESLVAMRNGLVHHFLDRFDLQSDDGCQAAIAHLAHCRERAEEHFAQLQDWAESIKKVQAYAATFVGSDTFQALVADGSQPKSRIEWTRPLVAILLQEGLRKFGSNGWASLYEVTSWLRQNHPEQTPKAYGCKTWRQFLHQSGVFELRFHTGHDGKKVPSYRERPSKMSKH